MLGAGTAGGASGCTVSPVWLQGVALRGGRAASGAAGRGAVLGLRYCNGSFRQHRDFVSPPSPCC